VTLLQLVVDGLTLALLGVGAVTAVVALVALFKGR